MTLGEALDRVQELGSDDVIFAARPWTHQSEADIGPFDSDYKIPDSYIARGLAYFLEASVAQEILDGVADRTFNQAQLRDLLIFYAENDAFPEWSDR